ncbi:hypothetical protein Tco_0653581 [Tanacetum coccineum]|uniref:Uncharacterized protein n=1 Tax=Tanacetum coccineum TaxID=301880 RepID=A0ABQ4X0X9_9ASTR
MWSVVFKFGWERSEEKEGANMAIADANNEKEHVNYVEGASQRQSNGNIGQGVKPKSIGPTSYAKLVTSESSRKSLNFRTLITLTRNRADVAVLSKDGLDAMLENGPWFIRNNPLILKKWDPYVNLFKKMLGRSSYARAMMEVRANIELKETIVVAMPKFVGEGFYMCTILGSSMSGNLLSVRVARQATRGVMIGPKVENDDELGMNRGISKSAGKGSVNVAHGSSSNTPIIDKIDKLELQMLDGKLIFVDDERNLLVPIGNVDSETEVEVVETKLDDDYDPYDEELYESHDMSDHLHAICDDLDIMVALVCNIIGESDDDGKTLKKVDYPVNLGSDDEVEPVDNENASYLASKPIGLDMENSDKLRTICDNLDIKVRGQEKK